MIKMAFGLSFQAEDSMIANNFKFVIAQLRLEPFSTRDARAEEVEQDIHSATNGADDDSVLDRDNKDNEHESEEIVGVTVN